MGHDLCEKEIGRDGRFEKIGNLSGGVVVRIGPAVELGSPT